MSDMQKVSEFVDNIQKWNEFMMSLTADEIQWILNHNEDPVVVDLTSLDKTVFVDNDSGIEEGHVVQLERLLSKVRKKVNELQ